MEPFPASRAHISGKGEFRMPGDAAPQPGGGIAEGLAAVLAPAPGAARGIGRSQRQFAPLGAPSEFAPGARAELPAEMPLPAVAQGIAEPDPDEVRQLVGEDSGKLGGCAVESDAPVAEKAAGVDGAPAIAEAAGALDVHGCARQGRHAAEDAHRGRALAGIVEDERQRVGQIIRVAAAEKS